MSHNLGVRIPKISILTVLAIVFKEALGKKYLQKWYRVRVSLLKAECNQTHEKCHRQVLIVAELEVESRPSIQRVAGLQPLL